MFWSRNKINREIRRLERINDIVVKLDNSKGKAQKADKAEFSFKSKIFVTQEAGVSLELPKNTAD